MKKKILAFLMALVITAGMMPYACAAGKAFQVPWRLQRSIKLRF
jgi:hypothetical protein